ncbi:glycine/betaine ABC transporter substrate-binding protein [Cohnella pontilimi]|uniref:Glycine/betaine ABC transporter substrate-binding protein n=1 Tax=Cohnella pontilimi TaxID=2564100 RepID=A0A4U0F7W2_9BACL|nr:glycine betaine ABC transporter substrate-binding protein [Cohnella pontilimi]TJY40681.1 glycine/betaine ABC transporter substrate-binding protein [Cohnella pontilimi]
MRKGKAILLSALSLILLFVLSACGGSKSNGKTIAVGSKDFTESFILAELYSLALEDQGFKVDRKFNLGGTAVAQAAMEKGDIQMYPEYTGTGLLQVLKLPMMTDAQQVYDTVAAEYKKKFNMVWLSQTEANDSQGLVITKAASDKYGIKTISDLQKQASNIRFAATPIFAEVADGLPALEKTYGKFDFKELKAFDNGLRYSVLENGQMDLAVAFTTEGQLTDPKYVLLEDDKHVWPPYNIAPIVKQETLDKYPEIKDVLNKISAKLDTPTMQKLNGEVDLKKREYAEVAKEFYDNNFKK